jgi:hypothetical protein
LFFYDIVRAEITPETRPSDITPVAPLTEQIHVANNGNHDSPRSKETTEKGMTHVKFEVLLQDSVHSDAQVPPSYPAFYIMISDGYVPVLSDLSGNSKTLRSLSQVSSYNSAFFYLV